MEDDVIVISYSSFEDAIGFTQQLYKFGMEKFIWLSIKISYGKSQAVEFYIIGLLWGKICLRDTY